MKVILLQDVAQIGKRFEVVSVPDGHALNHLIPKRMAEVATPQSLKRLKERTQKQEAERAAASQAFTASCERLSGATVDMPAPANEQGNLFKGITSENIAEHLAETYPGITAEHIELSAPIKETGTHEITVSGDDTSVTFSLTIYAQ